MLPIRPTIEIYTIILTNYLMYTYRVSMRLIERLILVSKANDIVLARLYITCYNHYMRYIDIGVNHPFISSTLYIECLSEYLENAITGYEWCDYP